MSSHGVDIRFCTKNTEAAAAETPLLSAPFGQASTFPSTPAATASFGLPPSALLFRVLVLDLALLLYRSNLM